MKIKVVDETNGEIYSTDIPNCEKLNAWGYYDYFTSSEPYIFESVNYLRDNADNRDEIIVRVRQIKRR